MKAVVLAAGVGSRLRPMTNEKPKCLVKTAGKAILQYQLDSYKEAGIVDIAVVVGYEGKAIKEYLKHVKDFNITIIENGDYETTNNMYSLYLAKNFINGEAFILNNADLSIDKNIVSLLVNNKKESLIAVDKGKFNEESMKIEVVEGKILDISKKIEIDRSYGCSIDFYKISKEASNQLFSYITKVVEVDSNLKDWTEVAIQHLLKTKVIDFEPIDINGSRWVEIDNYEDLAQSDMLFSNYLEWKEEIETYFFDLDGTLYSGNNVFIDAIAKVKEIMLRGREVYFLSNNSSKKNQTVFLSPLVETNDISNEPATMQ
jgi:choline kinase